MSIRPPRHGEAIEHEQLYLWHFHQMRHRREVKSRIIIKSKEKVFGLQVITNLAYQWRQDCVKSHDIGPRFEHECRNFNIVSLYQISLHIVEMNGPYELVVQI